MHARKLPVVLLLLVSVTACGGGEPVAAPVEPAPVTAPQPVAAEEDAEDAAEGYADYWSPAAVASLEAAKASYVPPPKKAATEATTSTSAPTATQTTNLTTTPTQTAPAPSPSPSPSPSPTPLPSPTPQETYSPAPYEPDPTRPEATEPTIIFVQVLDCAPDAQAGWTRVDYILYMEGTDGWTIHREDNMRPHDPVETSSSELISATDKEPERAFIADPEETRWAFRAESASLANRFAVPYHEDVVLRSPEGVVTPVPTIGFLVPRDLCKLG